MPTPKRTAMQFGMATVADLANERGPQGGTITPRVPIPAEAFVH